MRKGCDWIVANDVSADTGVMGGDRNTVHLVTAERRRSLADASRKEEVARRLVARIAAALQAARMTARRGAHRAAAARRTICRCPPIRATARPGSTCLAAVPPMRRW